MSTEQAHGRWTAPPLDAASPEPTRVVVVERTTIIAPKHNPELDEAILRAEHHMPDGRGTSAHERAYLPWLIAGLAIFGVVGIFVLLTLTDNWQAGLLGAGWVMGGYCVAWIVVWGAGLARASDEKHIEETLTISNDLPPPQD